MQDQHARLTRIGERHREFLHARRDASLYAHLHEALAHEQKLETLTDRSNQLETLRAQNAEQRADYEAAIRERAEMLHRLSTFLADASLALDAPGSLEEVVARAHRG